MSGPSAPGQIFPVHFMYLRFCFISKRPPTRDSGLRVGSGLGPPPSHRTGEVYRAVVCLEERPRAYPESSLPAQVQVLCLTCGFGADLGLLKVGGLWPPLGLTTEGGFRGNPGPGMRPPQADQEPALEPCGVHVWGSSTQAALCSFFPGCVWGSPVVLASCDSLQTCDQKASCNRTWEQFKASSIS